MTKSVGVLEPFVHHLPIVLFHRRLELPKMTSLLTILLSFFALLSEPMRIASAALLALPIGRVNKAREEMR